MIKYGSNKLGKIYYGGHAIGEVYYGSNLVFRSGGGPSPTIQTPYLRNSETGAYIDTGITPDNTTRVITWARNFNPGGRSSNGSATTIK